MIVSPASMITEIIHKRNKSHWQSDQGPRPDISDLAEIDGARLWDNILQSALIGGIPGTTGKDWLALSDSDKLVCEFIIARAKEIGYGKNNFLPPIGIGSHLDTQPNGGRFDGILGVFAALEVLRAVKESNIVTNRPLAAINWTNERVTSHWRAHVLSLVAPVQLSGRVIFLSNADIHYKPLINNLICIVNYTRLVSSGRQLLVSKPIL
ncbi:Zn-dependent exopeptidase [Clathrospora elynae]|uniref:Zn-dependent exopeptidase n=1 Tax=Clathrospora elynae TaxID=706981 RepID=A0A6A5S3S7_9PLEO|nr:Zn-dependent exopeptidase [Clathrospora elynae]